MDLKTATARGRADYNAEVSEGDCPFADEAMAAAWLHGFHDAAAEDDGIDDDTFEASLLEPYVHGFGS